MKYMEYWNGSTLVEAIDVVINFNKSIFFQIHHFKISIDGYMIGVNHACIPVQSLGVFIAQLA